MVARFLGDKRVKAIRDEIRTAKNSHNCDACYWYDRSGYGEVDFSAEDWSIIQAAKEDKWKIKAGEKYRHVVHVEGGEFSTYRAKLGMDALCSRNSLFPEC